MSASCFQAQLVTDNLPFYVVPTERVLKTNTGFIIAFNVTITSQLPDKAEHKAKCYYQDI